MQALMQSQSIPARPGRARGRAPAHNNQARNRVLPAKATLPARAGRRAEACRRKQATLSAGPNWPAHAALTAPARESLPAGANGPPDQPSALFAPPCFFWSWCAQRSALEKAGRSVCRKCAQMLRGTEYPLRIPSGDPRQPEYSLPAEDIELIGA